MTAAEVKDVVGPTSPDAGSARHADLASRGPVHGALMGVAVTTTVLLAWIGAGFHSGRGVVVDWLTAAVLGWAAVAVLGGLLLLLAWLLKRIPTRLLAFGAASAVVVGGAGLWNAAWLGPILAGVLLVAGGLAGAGMGMLARRGHGLPLRAVVAATTTGVGVVGLVAAVLWLAAGAAPPDPGGPAPSGPHAVRTLTYGSGLPANRPEFGADATVRTDPVDASALMDGWTGWLGARRTAYWGFGPDALPLNATVWAPAAVGPFPLVLVVHGNAPMEVASDTGYAWLAEDLASRGYVVVAVDENFLNISWTRGWDLRRDSDVRAWLLLEHLRLWRGWNTDPSSPLHGAADLDRIALIGHSRGGEAVATAAAFARMDRYPEDATVTFDAGFGIDAVVAFAPVEGDYHPGGRPTPLGDTSYLLIHGGRDGDVFWVGGMRQLERTTFTGERFAAKALLWLPDANHAQFNTAWGRRDYSGLTGAVLDTGPVMAPEDQRAAAGTAVTAFLDATVRGETDRLGIFTDPGHDAWAAAPGVITRYTDSTETTIAGFTEDADPATGTLPEVTLAAEGLKVWREEPAAMRRGGGRGNAAVLGWARTAADAAPAFRITLPEGWSPLPDPVLRVSLADSGEATPVTGNAAESPVDLTIEAVDAGGRTLRARVGDLGGTPVAPRARRFKAPLPDWAGSPEPLAQTFQIPLRQTPAGFDPSRLREIRIVFDRTPEGLVLLEHVGIAAGTP